jgi:hypothetical protein
MKLATHYVKKVWIAAIAVALMGLSVSVGNAQTRNNAYHSGEVLVYKVKYGFVKLGTLVVQTGGVGADGKAAAKMQFWTADVPFLNAKTQVTDVIDTKDNTLVRFSEKSSDGDKQVSKSMVYDRTAKTLTYSDNNVSNEVSKDISPFTDALGLLYNMRTWSGSGQKYSFSMRGKDGARPVVISFTKKVENQEVPALNDKEIQTRVLEGHADMGTSSPLGANGAFTAYLSDDEAAIPVRIDMSIALGSISLVLDQIKGRSDWAAAK